MLGLSKDYPKETAILGRLLAGYGELEFGLLSVLSSYLPPATAMKIMFRTRGEDQRIQLADAIIRDRITTSPLLERYSETVADMGHCKTIRNQYAHCHWNELPGHRLGFNDLEAVAKSRQLNPMVKFTPTTAELLAEQAAYFEFVARCFAHVSGECEKAEGRTPILTGPWPKKVVRPPLHNG